VPQQILDRLPKPRVGLRLSLVKLRFQPRVQLIHHRLAALLMKSQPLFLSQTALARFGIVAIHLAQHLQHVAAFAGEVLRYVHELPASVRETVGQQDLHA